MTRNRVLIVGAGLASLVSIVLAGIEGTIGTLATVASSVALLVFVPTALPFLLLAVQRFTPKLVVATVAAPAVLGWAYVIFIESKPYAGGGASMVVLLGWAACVFSALFALIAILAASLLKARRRWSNGG